MSGLLEQPSAHNVGRSVSLRPGASATVLDLAGSDAEARTLGVALSLRPASFVEPGAAAIARGEDELAATAQIELGSGGHRLGFDVDIGRGVVLSLHGAAVRVTVRNRCRAELEVGAFASYAFARSGPPRLSVQGPSLGSSEAWVTAAPSFTADVDVLAVRDAAIDVDVGFGRLGQRWAYGAELRPGSRLSRPIPLVNGCAQLRVTNRGPSPVTPLLLFTLAL